MTLSMSQATLPVLSRALGNLKVILEKGAAHAQARKIEDAAFTEARLFPDMFPLCRQVHIATDIAKGGAARLAGVEAPRYEDTERSFAELIGRVEKTIAYLHTLKAEQIDGSEERAITLQLRSGDLHFKGQGYLLDFVLPNVYFHITTSYNILRHGGVEVGKQDFLGGI